jgi:hypothetical protein
MCLVAYIAASKPLPLIAWRPEARAFHVADRDAGAVTVRSQLALPFVYYVGSHEGCGCGFNRDSVADADPAQLAETRKTLAALGDYLQAAVAAVGPLELYTCWNGDESEPVERRLTVPVSAFGPEMTWFPERSHVTIVADGPLGQEQSSKV